MLKFSYRNSKMNKLARQLGLKLNQIASFDLPAGWSCPAANICLSYADPITGKITDGENSQFRCYASSTESAFTNARKLHWHNFDALKLAGVNNVDALTDLIEASFPSQVRVLRIHSSGDYFSKAYFQAWVRVAKNHPNVNFFGYTKMLPYVSAPKPENFKLVYSMGGKLDHKVTNEPVSYVVPTVESAIERGLIVSCNENPVDDYYHVMAGRSFALALHGTQPAGGATLE